LGTKFCGIGHVGIAGVIMVDEVMELCCLPKKCISNIGHWIQQWSCGDFWCNIGKVANGIMLHANNV